MNALAAFLLASLGTYALRHVSARALANRQLPPVIGVVLRRAALAVMAALVISSLPQAQELGAHSASAIAGLAAAAIVARRTESVSTSLAIGIAVHVATTAITGAVVA